MTLIIDSGYTWDADATAYIEAVEAADAAAGQTGGLEEAARKAIENFVVGCKVDGIWNAIKVGCILAGAKSLPGAYIDLKTATKVLDDGGPSSPRFSVGTYVGSNYTTGDYNRKTGLVGDGSTKYLNSNRLNNASPRNNAHISFYVSTGGSQSGIRYYLGGGTNGFHGMFRNSTNNTLGGYVSTGGGAFSISGQGDTVGLKGATRSLAGSIDIRSGGVTTVAAQNSADELTPYNLAVFAVQEGTVSSHINARLAFYSIGESLDLEKLDARVTALINAFGAAIP